MWWGEGRIREWRTEQSLTDAASIQLLIRARWLVISDKHQMLYDAAGVDRIRLYNHVGEKGELQERE
jgi:hypothetical protein